eukprot:CCRYP_014154-RA/>CCRYP_014154-RA protein AED:0.47 eAED:0.47 QI:153/1/1/1/0/0/2/29/56
MLSCQLKHGDSEVSCRHHHTIEQMPGALLRQTYQAGTNGLDPVLVKDSDEEKLRSP